MSTLRIAIPDSVRSRVEHLAREEGVSVEEFVASVLAQRIAVAEADSYVRMRAQRGSAEQLLEVLAKAPEVEPGPHDRVSNSGNDTGAKAD